jgi:hypothetical protein
VEGCSEQACLTEPGGTFDQHELTALVLCLAQRLAEFLEFALALQECWNILGGHAGVPGVLCLGGSGTKIREIPDAVMGTWAYALASFPPRTEINPV